MREESALRELVPRGGNIPSKDQWTDIAGQLGEEGGGPLRQVTYTWRDGQTSMELLLGSEEPRPANGRGEIRLVRRGEEEYPYALYVPRGYDPGDRRKKWPLVFFFHGIGERGDDPAIVLRHGLLRHLAEGGALDAIVVAPQCPADSHWADAPVELEKLRRFLPQMMEKLPVDKDKVYLTGLSMGGRCCWKLALAMPDTFAAMAVICGRTTNYEFQVIRDMPLWMFHGVQDSTPSFDNIGLILPRLLESGHRYYKLTVYPQGGHAVWAETYARAALYNWLLDQSLSENRAFAAARKTAEPCEAVP